jgi:hypothetical protein
VLGSQVLLECQAISKRAPAPNGTDPVLTIELLRGEVRRQQAVVNVENKVKLPAFQHVRRVSLPRQEVKVNLVAFTGVAAAQTGKQCDANIVRPGNAKIAPLTVRIENAWRNQVFYPGKKFFKVLENLLPAQGEFKTRRRRMRRSS